jgi:ATP-dependent Clp protease protease subunit
MDTDEIESLFLGGSPLEIEGDLFEDRIVFIEGRITENMGTARRQIMQLSMEGSDPIRLIINSPGGAVNGAMAVLDAMELAKQRGVRFIGVVQGDASSAALVILQGCDERIAGRYSVLMAHGSHGVSNGDRRRQAAIDKYVNIVHKQTAQLFALRTKRSYDEWLKIFEDETPNFYSAEEALMEGLVDRIV